MANVRVVDDVYTDVVEYGDGEPYGRRDCTAEHHNIQGIQVVGEKEYYDLSTGFDIDPTRPYYLLYAIYSTGDSFGHDDGRIEFVGLYEDLEVAHENEQRVWAHNETYQQLEYRWYTPSKQLSKEKLKNLRKEFEPYTIKLVTEDGLEYGVHVPWHGYFERLTEVVVQPVLVR